MKVNWKFLTGLQSRKDGISTTMGYTLIPAYGRDYKSKAAVLKDWNDGKDFQIAISGQYCSIRDADKMDSISIRYDRKTKVLIVK